MVIFKKYRPDIDSNKLVELLIIAAGGRVVTEPRTYSRKEKTKAMSASLDKKDSKGAYSSIINDLRLTDKEDFRKSI